MPNEMNSPSVTDGFHLVVNALKLNGINTIYDIRSFVEMTGIPYLPMSMAKGVTDPRNLTKALTDALASGKPALINCVIDPTAGTESGHLQNLNPQSHVGKGKGD